MESVRSPRPIPPDSPGAVYADELAHGRQYLDVLRVHHLDLGRRVLEAAGGALFIPDFLIGAILTRSYALLDGFLSAFDTWSPIVAAPLLRMQIDSLVRLGYASRHSPNVDELTLYVMGGGEFRKLKDADGKLLTDRRLLEPAEADHPWLAPVYAATSGWVHLSPAHLHAAWKLGEETPGDDGRPVIPLAGGIPLRRELIPISALDELLGAMIKATEELFGYVEIWEARKGLPLGQVRPLGQNETGPDSTPD